MQIKDLDFELLFHDKAEMIETGRRLLIISTFAGAFELAALHSAESGDSDGLDGRLGRALQTAHQDRLQR